MKSMKPERRANYLRPLTKREQELLKNIETERQYLARHRQRARRA